MDFTGTWKTRGGHIVKVEEQLVTLTYRIDETGKPLVGQLGLSKDFDLMLRLSGYEGKRADANQT